jgi:hypothetical protein
MPVRSHRQREQAVGVQRDLRLATSLDRMKDAAPITAPYRV